MAHDDTRTDAPAGTLGSATGADFDTAVPMSDDTARQQDADDVAAKADFDSAIPMSDATADQQEADLTGTASAASTTTAKLTEVKQTAIDGASKLGTQAADKARSLAADGKARAGGALDQLSQMLTDAAGQVDEKLGAQYGQYARQAATTVQGFSDSVKNKEIEDLLEEARGFVRKSPAIAIGAAAAVGFVVARLIQSGLDDSKA